MQLLFKAFFTTLSDLYYGSNLYSPMLHYRSIVPQLCSRRRRVSYGELSSTKCYRRLGSYQ
jgi:hypothetical protein